MTLLIYIILLPFASALRVAVVGEGVIGLSTALAIKEKDPSVEIHVFHDRHFNHSLSKNVAGLFRIDNAKYRKYGNETFVRLAKLWREFGGKSGVQLVSGHILSEDRQKLMKQKQNYGDIVYNFRFLDEREKRSQFLLPEDDNSSAIHFTAFTSEGGKYCPWMKQRLQALGVHFHNRTLTSIDELGDEGFPVVINCAGINGGRLAGDDDTVFPIRGVLLKVDAPWQKHFLYRDFQTFTIPLIDGVYVGTVKQDHRNETRLLDGEVDEIWHRYMKLQPAMNNTRIVSIFIGLRPGRPSIRLEAQQRTTESGANYLAVHNYGQGGNGFTLSWGCGLHAAELALRGNTHRYELKRQKNTQWRHPFHS